MCSESNGDVALETTGRGRRSNPPNPSRTRRGLYTDQFDAGVVGSPVEERVAITVACWTARSRRVAGVARHVTDGRRTSARDLQRHAVVVRDGVSARRTQIHHTPHCMAKYPYVVVVVVEMNIIKVALSHCC